MPFQQTFWVTKDNAKFESLSEAEGHELAFNFTESLLEIAGLGIRQTHQDLIEQVKAALKDKCMALVETSLESWTSAADESPVAGVDVLVLFANAALKPTCTTAYIDDAGDWHHSISTKFLDFSIDYWKPIELPADYDPYPLVKVPTPPPAPTLPPAPNDDVFGKFDDDIPF